MAILLTGLALLYLACVGFFHAAPERYGLVRLGQQDRPPQYLRAASWILALAGLLVLSWATGFERGFTQWIGLFTLAGALSLFIVSRWPTRHEFSAIIAGGIALLALGAAFLTGTM